MAKIDVINKKFKTFIAKEEVFINNRKYYVCICEKCGLKKNIRKDILISLKFKKCSCEEDSKFIGKKFGKLTVVRKALPSEYKVNNKRSCWWCICDCGNPNEIIVLEELLKNNHVTSCGCKQHTEHHVKHNLSKTRLYNIWTKMKQRCFNKNNKDYCNYGGRGITICEEWIDPNNGFINFYNWAINNGYKENLTIERIDVNGNYEPKNCTWILNEEQANNRRTTNWLLINGERLNVTQAAKKFNVSRTKIYNQFASTNS